MAGIKISEVQERWSISRPTIMKAVKNGKLSGEKDEIGRWLFAIDEVVRWRGEPKSDDQVPVNDLQPVTPPDQSELVAALKQQVEQLSAQVDVKDTQIDKLQEQMRDQTKLLEHQSKGWMQKLFGK